MLGCRPIESISLTFVPFVTLNPHAPLQAKKYDRAIAILAKHQWWDKLIGVVRQLDKTDARCLGMCAGHFRRAPHFAYAKETLLKMDDTKVGAGGAINGYERAPTAECSAGSLTNALVLPTCPAANRPRRA